MPRYTKKRKTYRKKKSAKRKSSVKRAVRRTLPKPRTGNFSHVKLIKPISRKPYTDLTRHVYYTKAVLQNRLSQVALAQATEAGGPIPGYQQMQYCTLHLNSPGIFNDLGHLSGNGKCSWTWQDDANIKSWRNDSTPDYIHTGTAPFPTYLPGFFDSVTRAGVQYLNHCCLHYKLTVTATPMPSECEKLTWTDPAPSTDQNSRTINNQSGVLFITKHSSSSGTNPSSLSNTHTLQDLYKRPFTKYAKFKAGASTQGMNVAGGLTNHGTAVMDAGARKSASVSMTWKPQRMHGLKDISDNMQLRAQTSSPQDPANFATTMQLMNPAELDGITFGIVPEFQAYAAGAGDALNNDWVPQSCGRVMLSMRIEAVYKHSEPNKQGENIPGGADPDSGVPATQMLF